MKILLGICGSSGTNLGLKLLENLEKKAEIYCIITNCARLSFEKEYQKNMDEICKIFKNVKFLDNNDLSECVSSGSFGIEKTIIAPCSISTLAKIHAGFADTLLTRAAAVALKERKTLILGVREMPFSTLSLEHMAKLSLLGCVIAPPIYASYGGDSENFIVGKWLDLLGIENNLFKRWKS